MTLPGQATGYGQWPAGRGGAGVGTGHPDVDAVVATLGEVAAAPLDEQVAGYTEAHRALQQILRTIDAD